MDTLEFSLLVQQQKTGRTLTSLFLMMEKVYLDKIPLYDYIYIHTKLQIQITKKQGGMVMATKNIYVSEADLHLFDDAAKYAGSVSAAVIQALQDFLSVQRNKSEGYDKIELNLYKKGIRRKVMFYGMEITRVERPVDGGIRIDTIYKTAKGQFAVATKVRKELPNWAKGNPHVWENPQSWSHDFWNLGDRVLNVYPDIESLKEKDAYLAECCESSLSEKPYEFLDI